MCANLYSLIFSFVKLLPPLSYQSQITFNVQVRAHVWVRTHVRVRTYVRLRTHERVRTPRCKLGTLHHSLEELCARGPQIGHLPIDLVSGKIRIKTKSKMFEEIYKNKGFNYITEKILIKLDVESLLKCRLVCKGLHQFITSLEKSRSLKKKDFKIIREICWKNMLAHSNWKAAFNSIVQEDIFFRRWGLIDCLLETYYNQDKIIQSGYDIITNSYLNTSKFLMNEVVQNFAIHKGSFYNHFFWSFWCLTCLNLSWIKSYDIKHNFFHFCFFASSWKLVKTDESMQSYFPAILLIFFDRIIVQTPSILKILEWEIWNMK